MPSDFQAFNDAAVLEMLFDDLVEIPFILEGVPNTFWINHDDRAVVAAIHASGGVDADVVLAAGNIKLLDLVLDIVARLLRAVIAATILAIIALISAEKNMFVVKTHGSLLKGGIKRNYTFRMRHRWNNSSTGKMSAMVCASPL